jgi:hypothetical protein
MLLDNSEYEVAVFCKLFIDYVYYCIAIRADVFGDLVPCSLVDGYLYFGGT